MANVECELMTQDTIDVEIDGAGVVLQDKSVDVEYNGTTVVRADDGFDGLKSVEINTNVPKRFECGDGYFLPITSAQKNLTLISRLQKVDISCWDTSNVTYMWQAFYQCISLQNLDVSGWDTSKVTDMRQAFYQCISLQNLDVSGWDTSNVTNMWQLFYRCSSLQQLNVSGWDTSNVTNTNDMFTDCSSLHTIIGEKTLSDVENGLKTMIGIKLSIKTNHSPLRFSSILAIVNGFADMTGKTAQTLTISRASYNNMYNDDDTVPTADVIAERRARIAAICAAKNWNFAY